MVMRESHGGSCCGAKHLHDFGRLGIHDRVNVANIEGLLNPSVIGSDQLVEVILTQEQCLGLPSTLTELNRLGFVLDASWLNSNSNNRLYRFSRCNTRYALAEGAPNWQGRVITHDLQGSLEDQVQEEGTIISPPPVPAPRTVAPPPPPTPVFYTYHCVFRNGRRGAGYDTVEEAVSNLGRRTRIDRRAIMSDGSIEWWTIPRNQ